jgi:hypothetical protein
MSTTPSPSGLRFRQIRTTTETFTDDLGATQTRVVPLLDEHGREIEVSSIDVPLDVEANGGEAVQAHVAAQYAMRSVERAITSDAGGESPAAPATSAARRAKE